MARHLKEASRRQTSSVAQVRESVAEILNRIEHEGLPAVRDYSTRLDDWCPDDFRVGAEQVAAAEGDLEPSLREHISFALEQIRRFALAQREALSDVRVETLPGVTLGHRFVPVQHVGAYVPGGRYPLISTALMTIAVAKTAGVGKVTAVAPPASADGIAPATVSAMAMAGADQIYCIGGVQAIASLAFGLGGVPGVDMIVGPGNAYVAEAKRQLFGRIGIDLVAGPSEILVLADRSADPEVVALDLLAQAEHGPDSRAVLVSWDRELAEDVACAVDTTLAQLPKDSLAAESWRACGEVIVADDGEEALALANSLAMEHVHIQAGEDWIAYLRDGLRNFGSLFLGEAATVVFGDKAIGTNHCLPTGRGARYTGGLWVGSFLRALSYQEVAPNGARVVAPAAAAIARAEGMELHARSATLRLDPVPSIAASSAPQR